MSPQHPLGDEFLARLGELDGARGEVTVDVLVADDAAAHFEAFFKEVSVEWVEFGVG